MTPVICAIAKNENAYLLEWAEHHIALGFSHIYLYDNNDVDGEHITDVFRSTTFVDKISIINVRGQKYIQKHVYNECYHQFDFDWCAFIDIDEFIVLDKHKNISDFLNSFSQQEAIHLNWKCYGDSGQITSQPMEVKRRFQIPWKKEVYYGYTDKTENSHIKSIIRKGVSLDWEYEGSEWGSNPHTPYGLKVISNAKGELIENSPFAPICHEVAYICHYTTKSIEEYAVKVSRQCADCAAVFYSFSKFFRVNRITFSKILWLKKYYPSVSIWECIKEHVKYCIINYKLPLKFLFRSLKR